MSVSGTESGERYAIPEVGSILDGKFRIDGILGTGGMAVVLGASHLQLEQRVAVKLLLPAYAEDPDVVSRFLLEGRSASKIRSEHVARVLDVGMVDERAYLVMEYLDGLDLDALLAQRGPLHPELAVDYLLQACEAIAEAHVAGIIHRDLKPSNLFLTHRADGAACVKVLDFGISKLLQPRSTVLLAHETLPLVILGTPHYMSPELMQSATSADQRSDIWALGAILQELVAGKPPFGGDSITALCAAILMGPPRDISSPYGDLPPGLGAVVRRCLEKDPAARFANVAELATALAPMGSSAARASATCIERVLGGGLDAPPAERVSSAAEVRAPTAAETLASGSRHLARGILAHLAVVGLMLSVFSAIGWVVLRGHHWGPTATGASQAAAVVPPAAASNESSSTPGAAPVTVGTHLAPHRPAAVVAPPRPGAPDAGARD